ncbi:MAG: hypothetical protein LBV13_01645 [Methanomassiliicoccaceae archaeon]|nr:hypothetical protein [Methanomassiliicoccaceae archaeon]
MNITRTKITATLAIAMMSVLTVSAFGGLFADPVDDADAIIGDGAAVAGYPLMFGLAIGPNNDAVPLMSYLIGSNGGTVPLDERVYNYPRSDTFAQFETYPDSDHPDGVAYVWIYDDSDNIYFILDWTSDDTYDAGDDYFTVYINDGTGVRSYTQTSTGGEYGISVFGYTDTIDYEHMYYVIAVPKTEIDNDLIKVGFEMYGTVSIYGKLEWNETPPDAAFVGEDVTFSLKYYEASTYGADKHRVWIFQYDDDTDLTDFLKYNSFDEDGFRWWNGTGYTYYAGPVTVLCLTDFYLEGGSDLSGVVDLVTSFDLAGTYKLAVLISYLSRDDDGSGYFWTRSGLAPPIAEVAVSAVAPTMTGPTSLSLTEGYAATSTDAYTIGGTVPVTVTKTNGDTKITWNDTTKKLDIAPGLTAGTYEVILKASNISGTDAMITFTLTVNPRGGPEGGSDILLIVGMAAAIAIAGGIAAYWFLIRKK